MSGFTKFTYELALITFWYKILANEAALAWTILLVLSLLRRFAVFIFIAYTFIGFRM